MVRKIGRFSFMIPLAVSGIPFMELLFGVGFLIILSCQNEHPVSVKTPDIWLWDTCPAKSLVVREPMPVDDTWQETRLPHRILLPNNAIWYHAGTTLNPEALLFVDADDGAQVFFNGKHIPAWQGYYYKVEAKNQEGQVHIRVLNNAMAGGLRTARWLNADSMQSLWSERHELLDQLEEIFLSNLYKADVFLPEDQFVLHQQPAVKFTIWGDSQGKWEKFQNMCNQMLAIPGLQFSIGLGDLVADGANKAQWISFMTCLAPLIEKGVKIFPIPGNHDYDGYYDDLQSENYRRFVGHKQRATYTSWTAGPAIFMALDPNINFPLGLDSIQLKWAMDRLNSEEWKKAHWHFLLIHQPPYAQGWSGYQGDDFIRNFVDSLSEKYHIDFVLSGHAHDFEYLKKKYGFHTTHFLVSGGGGGELEPEGNDQRIQMDMVLKEHHYLTFEVDQLQVKVQAVNLRGRKIWELGIPASETLIRR